MRKIGFFEHLVQRAVERPRRGEVAPERLLDDDARILSRSRARQPLNDGGEHAGGIAR